MYPSRLSSRVAIGGAALAVVLCVYHTVLSRRFLLDDALIYSRYVSNALEGHGLVYNIGERFNGATSPLFTYLSLLFAVVFRDVLLSEKIFACLCLSGTCVAVVAIFQRAGLGAFGVVSALIISSESFYYCTFGLETPLLLLVASLCCFFFLSERPIPLSAACAALVLTRGEWSLLVLVLFAFYYVKHRAVPPLAAFALFGVLLLPHFVFSYFYYGSFLPHTLWAKIGQGALPMFGNGPRQIYEVFLAPRGIFALAAAGLLIAASVPSWHRQRHVGALILFALAHLAFYVGLGIPNYFWYDAIYFYLGAVLVGCGLFTLRNAMIPALGTFAANLACAVLIGTLVVAQMSVSNRFRHIISSPEYVSAGQWLREHTPPESKVACVEVGHIGWYSERYIVDLLGLVSPHNAELVASKDLRGWSRYYQPDYILVHVPLWPHELKLPKLLNEHYVLVRDFHVAKLALWKRRAN